MNKIFEMGKIMVLLFALTSCHNSLTQIEQLQQENEKLRDEIHSLQEQLSGYSFRAITIPAKNKLTLGEEYEALVGLYAINQNNPPITILCNLNGDKSIRDTLRYDKDWGMSVYKIKPDKIGKYMWGTEIRQKQSDGTDIVYVTLAEFTVKSN